MLNLQKGIVKYKDRDDIECLYGIKEDGTQYYFLDTTDTKKLANGNRIASTALVEAIDPMVKASHIGVIDENGNEVIPCTNKSIKLVPNRNDALIVEIAEPVSESVKDAISRRSDPLSATKLVSTPSVIKDKINNLMGLGGRYVCNDQFSESTICDINGVNIVNGEFYSFIGVGDNMKLYMAKNTPETDVVVFDLNTKTFVTQEENVVEKPEDKSVQEKVIEEQTSSVQPTKEENVIETPVAPIENINEGFAKEDIDTIALKDNQIVNEKENSTEIVEPVNEKPISDNIIDHKVGEEVENETPEVSVDEDENVDVQVDDNVENTVIDDFIDNNNNNIVEEEKEERFKDIGENISSISFDGYDDYSTYDSQEEYKGNNYQTDEKNTTSEKIERAFSDMMRQLAEKDKQLEEKDKQLEERDRAYQSLSKEMEKVEKENYLLSDEINSLTDENHKLNSKNRDQAQIIDLQKR